MTRHQNARQQNMIREKAETSNRTTDGPCEIPRLENKYQPTVNISGSQQAIRIKTFATI
jgi:hypothetical protein